MQARVSASHRLFEPDALTLINAQIARYEREQNNVQSSDESGSVY